MEGGDMNNFVLLTSCVMLHLPSALFAATDCRIVELPDRYEAICEGDQKIMADSSNDRHRSRQIVENQAPRANSSNIQAAGDSRTEGDRKKAKSPAVEKLIAFRNNKLQRSDVEAKKAIRRQMINAGRQTVPEPSYINPTTGDI